MEELIRFFEYGSNLPAIRVDTVQKIVESYITSPYFLWVCLILLMNKKNWKRPVMLVLFVHWLLRSTGDALTTTMEYVPSDMNSMSNENSQNWLVGIGIANIFWITGEIAGDWYALLRTRAIINNKKKLIPVYITCIIFNLIKVFSIFHFFYQFSNVNQGNDGNQNMTQFGLSWWILVAVIQASSFLYDLSVILCLKQNLFKQLKSYSLGKNSFIERFKKISEFRIVFSMLANISFFPIILLYIFFVLRYSLKNDSSVPFDDDSMEVIRKTVINVNFTLMYIDQILLKCYVKRDNNNNNNLTSSTKSYTPYSESLVSKTVEKSTFNESSLNKKSLNKKPKPIISHTDYLNISNQSDNTIHII
ncbi:hypothetical protein PIROE2DRAFT_1428 [Piromyces sp. E2]|nr:hypothetical protein PIROE2DRAFT_1428 [Piromyces sp. E2]|eukprot:OUM70542.1 hypothetical protein PIROE2DRAFT_1428 [Piromyces sp. E2]